MRWINRKNFETAIDLWHRFKGRAISRRAGYLILAAVALEADIFQLILQGTFKYVGVDLTINETPHWVSVSFAALAALLLIVDRLLPELDLIPAANPHDVALFKKFRSLLDDAVMHFLRTHDFGAGFSARYFKVFDEISAVWIGSRYEFEDAELAEVWAKFFPKNRELTRLIAYNTNPAEGNYDWCQPNWVHEDWHSPETSEKVRIMNEAATELADLVDQLDAIARRKLVSSPRDQ